MKKYQTYLSILSLLFVFILFTNAQEKVDKNKTKQTKIESTKMKQVQEQSEEVVIMETSMGTIELMMFRAEAPKTVENFVQLAKKGYYNGITFHRVIDNFMIQGGDPTGTGGGGESIYGKKFEDEISPIHKFDRAGLLAMANVGLPNTNGSQFFITLVPTPHLNGRHTIFGEVVAGMDIVKKIGKVQTNIQNNKPITPITMKKVYPKSIKVVKPQQKAEEKK